jgi:hypothetical protein
MLPPRLDENMETGPQSLIASELFGHEKGCNRAHDFLRTNAVAGQSRTKAYLIARAECDDDGGQRSR